MRQFFGFDRLQTGYRQEILAGITTFVTVAYIIIVNPAILEAAGIPREASMTATILTAAFGTLLMGIYANRPFAVAPYMGENAFIAYTVVQTLGYSWQTALGAIFFSGILFTILTISGMRGWLSKAIPKTLKYSFPTGIGLFLAFLGLNNMGVIALGVPGAPVRMADISTMPALIGIGGLGLMAVLLARKVKGAILLSILAITGILAATGHLQLPKVPYSPPPSLAPIFMQIDIAGSLTWGFIGVITSVLVMDFVDTMGTLLGLSARAGLLDEEANLPDIEKPMLADALATIAASIFGTTTAGIYIESAAGIEQGGKTGFTAVVIALLFLCALFFSPVLTIVPAEAYGPALVVVGMFMTGSLKDIDFNDYLELVPAFLTIVLMVFTFNIGVGITAGFVSWTALRLLNGRIREITAGMWLLSLLSLTFYIFYPYH